MYPVFNPGPWDTFTTPADRVMLERMHQLGAWGAKGPRPAWAQQLMDEYGILPWWMDAQLNAGHFPHEIIIEVISGRAPRALA
jgi:hypothetical protein